MSRALYSKNLLDDYKRRVIGIHSYGTMALLVNTDCRYDIGVCTLYFHVSPGVWTPYLEKLWFHDGGVRRSVHEAVVKAGPLGNQAFWIWIHFGNVECVELLRTWRSECKACQRRSENRLQS